MEIKELTDKDFIEYKNPFYNFSDEEIDRLKKFTIGNKELDIEYRRRKLKIISLNGKL